MNVVITVLQGTQHVESWMNERDKIYIQILHYGLLGLRDAALAGNVEHCAIEADHLHNVPSLIGELKEGRHDYYFAGERTLYLERVTRDDRILGFVLDRYQELWQELADLRNKA